MEASQRIQEMNSGNQKPSPGNDGIRRWILAPGNFTRQPWNQVQGYRDRIQANRNLHQAAIEVCVWKWIQATREPRSDPRQPGTFIVQLWNRILGIRKWARQPGTFTREPRYQGQRTGSESKQPVILAGQSWNQIQGSKNQPQFTMKHHHLSCLTVQSLLSHASYDQSQQFLASDDGRGTNFKEAEAPGNQK